MGGLVPGARCCLVRRGNWRQHAYGATPTRVFQSTPYSRESGDARGRGRHHLVADALGLHLGPGEAGDWTSRLDTEPFALPQVFSHAPLVRGRSFRAPPNPGPGRSDLVRAVEFFVEYDNRRTNPASVPALTPPLATGLLPGPNFGAGVSAPVEAVGSLARRDVLGRNPGRARLPGAPVPPPRAARTHGAIVDDSFRRSRSAGDLVIVRGVRSPGGRMPRPRVRPSPSARSCALRCSPVHRTLDTAREGPARRCPCAHDRMA